ncbi:hypothetical protein [Paenibacillus sp. 79R4]|uniref:hypothetical protein n=1 Tax=Paenibacillus sp. 79R4 TaxID=2212847 RepID=UPI001C4B27C0|nr:hypothetical protein [Paenibacillus sp. 79R4]
MAKGITLQELDSTATDRLVIKDSAGRAKVSDPSAADDIALKRTVDNAVGNLSTLQTTDKSNVVKAINELFTNVSDGKNAVAAAITGKGVPASGSDTFSQLSSKIGQIVTGSYAAINYEVNLLIDKPPLNTTTLYDVFTLPTGTTKFAFYSDGSSTNIYSGYSTNYGAVKINLEIRDAAGKQFVLPTIDGSIDGSQGGMKSLAIYFFAYDKSANKYYFAVSRPSGTNPYMAYDASTFDNSGPIKIGFRVTTGSGVNGTLLLKGTVSYF